MKITKTLIPLNAMIVAFAFADVAFADPVNYWNMVNGGKVSAENEFCLDTAADDTDRVDWEDGNCLIAGSRDYPANIGNADRRGLIFDVDVSAYGVRYISGGGSWSGTGKLTIGAGGYNSTRSWDRYHNLSMSEIHLAASQTWTRECAAQVSAKITAEDHVVWTLTSGTGGGLGRSGFEVSSSNDLSNAEIVLKSLERLSLINATAMLPFGCHDENPDGRLSASARFCDYASAAGEWTPANVCRTWFQVAKDLVGILPKDE